MRRDTYHDCLTFQEICDSRNYQALAKTRLHDLLLRSGAPNVTSAVWTMHQPPRADAYLYEVRFDSRAWTGLY